MDNKIMVTIDQINASRNIVLGTLRVLDAALVPGNLSDDLHNSKLHCQQMIKAMDGQIASMKQLAEETHKLNKKEKVKRKDRTPLAEARKNRHKK